MQKQKVLLADDDIALGKILALALQDSGYDVHYQTSATGLNTIVREWQPDIIVLDVELESVQARAASSASWGTVAGNNYTAVAGCLASEGLDTSIQYVL